MGHTCAPSGLIRSSVKDLASCFWACGFPSEDELDTGSSSHPMMQDERIAMEKGHDETSINNLHNVGDQIQTNQRLDSSEIKKFTQVGEPRFSEEDYIVFRFRENGEIYMIGEGRRSHNFHMDTNLETTKLSPAVAKKVEFVLDSRKGVMVNPDNNGVLPQKEEEEKGRAHVVIKDAATYHAAVVESCASNLSSDGSSTGSFTFPVLQGVEWIGSPVHLPKEEAFYDDNNYEERTDSPSCVGNCFRF